ncbi:hypothetical protein BH582_15380 [Vibrio sp. 10N.222.47.A9]|uniref:hypothetical protein n=1 Tax=Vibrio sp. 10N.222.47.A9 TaxID=1903178 RepID=UPI000978B5E3|nr:hypothetical protein [Vibrio sp. 10N.222.47.A9]OMO31049.1 hypothetical protein BH582_15380 [Vibrio sp. 10N.222.47.A9]
MFQVSNSIVFGCEGIEFYWRRKVKLVKETQAIRALYPSTTHYCSHPAFRCSTVITDTRELWKDEQIISQNLLNKFINQLDTLRSDNSKFAVNHRLFKKNLSGAENKVAWLTQENKRLVEQITTPMERADMPHTE